MALQPSICVLCAAWCESQMYLFFFSPYAASCWNYLVRLFNFFWVFDSKVLKIISDLLFWSCLPSKSSLLSVNGIKVVSELWFERNQRVEEKRRPSLESFLLDQGFPVAPLSDLFSNYSVLAFLSLLWEFVFFNNFCSFSYIDEKCVVKKYIYISSPTLHVEATPS